MFRPKPKPAKKRTSTHIHSATLYAILADIEALHERVHELAYYHFERPLPSTTPAYPYAPPSPSSAGLPAWYPQRSMPAFDQPPWYTHEYPGAVPSPRFERGPDSPAPVFRRRGGLGARGAHGTPRITRVAPDRRGETGVGKERRKRKRVRGQRAVEETEETEETEGNVSEDSEEDGDGDEEMQGDGGKRDGRGGLGGRFGGRGVAV